MTTEHKDIDYLKGRFEDGDRPTGEDFARLIDSCHNTKQLTDVNITKNLTVDQDLAVTGKINTRDVAADGSKLDTLDSYVRSNSDSWEETADIQAVTNTVATVSGVLSSNIHTVNSTLSTYIDNNISTIAINNETINTRVDNMLIELEELEVEVEDVTTTVADNSGAWGVDQHTYTLATLTDVDTTGVTHNSVLKYDNDDQKWYAATDLHGEGHHEDNFIELKDTPVAYTGANQFLKINETNDRLIFVTLNTDGWESSLNTVHSLSDTWAAQTDISDITSTVNTHSASWGVQTDVTDLTSTVNTNSASWGTQTDVTDLTSTVNTNSAGWGKQTDISELTSTVNTNSASWSVQTDVTDLTSTVNTNSGDWSRYQDLLDGDKLAEQYVPELCITRIYTVQTPTDVVDLTPGTGIQRGDIVVVQTVYDNLVATTNDPVGTYNETTQTYTGYNKLAVPAGSVNTVNGEYGPNVVLTSDDIDDTNQTNKWVSQSDIDNWNDADNKFVKVTGDTITGDLNTTARLLSGGVDLREIFTTSTDVQGDLTVNGNINTTGDVEAVNVQGAYKSSTGQAGITKNVNIGGNILHIVDGIIVGITDEV